VHVVTIVAIIGTNPIKAVEFLLDGLYKVLTGNNRIWHLIDLQSRIIVDVDVGLLLNSPCIKFTTAHRSNRSDLLEE
jgi:hypothetical protein